MTDIAIEQATADDKVIDAIDVIDPGDDVEQADDVIEDELLVEEISIDGMCGVY